MNMRVVCMCTRGGEQTQQSHNKSNFTWSLFVCVLFVYDSHLRLKSLHCCSKWTWCVWNTERWQARDVGWDGGGKKNHPPVPGGTPHHLDVSYELCMCVCNYSDTSPELDVNSVRSYLSAPAEPIGSACVCRHVCTCRLTNLCRRDMHMHVQDWACPKLWSILCICVSNMHKSSHVSCVFALCSTLCLSFVKTTIQLHFGCPFVYFSEFVLTSGSCQSKILFCLFKKILLGFTKRVNSERYLLKTKRYLQWFCTFFVLWELLSKLEILGGEY